MASVAAQVAAAAAATAMKQTLTVHSALYSTMEREMDATTAVQEVVAGDGTLHLDVGNAVLGGDPHPGSRKVLRVVYSANIPRGRRSAEEDEVLVIPRGADTVTKSTKTKEKMADGKRASASSLTIIVAKYGTEGKTVDVTETLRAMVEDGALVVRVSNELGGDPHPGYRKTLTVEYSAHVVQQPARAYEADALILP